MYLNDAETRQLMKKVNYFFETTIQISRIQIGKQQTFETLINEEALLFAKFLRGELKAWNPRVSKII